MTGDLFVKFIKPYVWIFLLYLTIPVSCKKPLPEACVSVTIDKPAENTLFYIPGNIGVHFVVSSTVPLREVVLNLTNEDFIPVAGNKVYHPDTVFFEQSAVLRVEPLQVKEAAKWYFHVTARTGLGTKNKYLAVKLQLKKLLLKNILFFQQIENKVVITDSSASPLMSTEGVYGASEFSTANQMLFLQTGNPARVSAFTLSGLPVLWSNLPQTTVEYTALSLNEPEHILYAARSDGSVYGYDLQTGNLIFSTPVRNDTVPRLIIGTEDFLFGEFYTLHNGEMVLITIYKNTGVTLYRQSAAFASQFLFPDEKNSVILIRNLAGGSRAIWYDAEKNEETDEVFISSSDVVSACRNKEGDIFACAGGKILLIAKKGVALLYESPVSVPVQMSCGPAEDLLFLLGERKFVSFDLSRGTIVSETGVAPETVAFQPVYDYE